MPRCGIGRSAGAHRLADPLADLPADLARYLERGPTCSGRGGRSQCLLHAHFARLHQHLLRRLGPHDLPCLPARLSRSIIRMHGQQLRHRGGDEPLVLLLGDAALQRLEPGDEGAHSELTQLLFYFSHTLLLRVTSHESRVTSHESRVASCSFTGSGLGIEGRDMEPETNAWSEVRDVFSTVTRDS